METPYISPTLRKLRGDHRVFAVLLDAIAKEAESAAHGGPVDLDFLSAAAGYFGAYPPTRHHPCEELIYGHLICEDPASAGGVFDLLEEHRSLIERTEEFRKAAGHIDDGAQGRDDFVREARAFIDAQRSHIKAEEEYFFPHAARALKKTQWAEIERGSCGACELTAEDAARSKSPHLARVLSRANGGSNS